jgi:hypothetical protein
MATNRNTEGFLVYPRTYFELKTGNGPKNATDALRWWEWRESRRTSNTIDAEEPDGNKMMREVNNTRVSLRLFVVQEYLSTIKNIAKRLGFMNEATGENAILTKDITSALCNLDNTTENNLLAYNIFVEFHKDRSWMANTIDKWLFIRKMILQPQVKVVGKKLYVESRGGFTAVARHAKANQIARFKDQLYKAKGWCIATSLPSTKAHKKDPKTYRLVQIIDPEHPEKEPTKFFYVVTPPCATIKAFKNEKHLTTERANIDEVVYIDYEAIAKCLRTTVTKVRNAIQAHVYFKPDEESDNNMDVDMDDMDMDGDEPNEELTEEEAVKEGEVDAKNQQDTITSILEAITEIESELAHSNSDEPSATTTTESTSTSTPNSDEPSATATTESKSTTTRISDEPSATTTTESTSTTTPPLVVENDTPKTPPNRSSPAKTLGGVSSTNGKTMTPVKRHMNSSPNPALWVYIPPRIRTPTPTKYPTNLFTSLSSPTLTILSPKRKTPSPNKKKSKVRQ